MTTKIYNFIKDKARWFVLGSVALASTGGVILVEDTEKIISEASLVTVLESKILKIDELDIVRVTT